MSVWLEETLHALHSNCMPELKAPPQVVAVIAMQSVQFQVLEHKNVSVSKHNVTLFSPDAPKVVCTK